MVAQSEYGNYSTTRLFQSIIHNDIVMFRALLQNVNIDIRDSEGNTPLLIACIYDRKELFRELIKLGANVNIANNYGSTVLHFASRNGWTKIVRYLVKKVPDLNASDITGDTAIHYALIFGYRKVVKCLMEEGADIRHKNHVGYTPLLRAAQSDNYGVFNMLLRSRACIGSNNSLLLYYALQNKWRKTALSLMKRVHYLDRALVKETTFYTISSKGEVEIVKFLLRGRTKNRMVSRAALCNAAWDGNLEVVKWLVEEVPATKEPDFRASNCSVERAIYGASGSGYLDIVKYLLEETNDINARILWGETALQTASKWGNLDVVTCLLGKGADTNVKSDDGSTSLLYAAEHNHEDIAALLIHSGANVNASSSDQCTTLHYATENGWIEIVKSLIQRGCDLDARDSNGGTALKSACLLLRMDIAQTLLQAGASWDITDNDGNSLFHYLVMKEVPEFESIKLLIENGAYFTPADYDAIVNSSSLKVVQDVELCFQAVVNKYNNRDLPELYKLPVSKSLPNIAKMKIKSGTEVVEAIERAVIFEIQTFGHCNILEMRPMALSILSVRSVLKIV